ncbi:MAG: single-stranded-DNA-specific exonuclease RecJ [Anaerolineae bacterium]|nr:single-stranded-DNA-specific exonuclease RecJ [Anaerolineae bacterium]
MRPKQWRFAPPAPPTFFTAFPDLPWPLAQTLFNRGYTDPASARAFLNSDGLDTNPFAMRGMQEAVRRLRDAIRRNEPIAVYGDYDVDGVTATALLVHALHALGASVKPYIPDRFEEGYGVNQNALEKLAQDGLKVIVTVDCGIRSQVETVHGRKLGLDIIITDHHEPAELLPAAHAILCPRQPRCLYPSKTLAGVGLAYKLAQALFMVEEGTPLGKRKSDLHPDDLLDLVALGTVADMAPLTQENRHLVRQGLAVVNQTRRLGLRALFKLARIEPGHVGVDTLSYIVGPRLNAAGRLEHAMISYNLLMTAKPAKAEALAAKLEEQNRQRQAMTEQTLTIAREHALKQIDHSRLLFVAAPDYPAGVVGLVANRLMEEYYRPAVVVELGDEESRGSMRSIPEFSAVDALDEVRDLLRKHGGHRAAAGFTVRNEHLRELETRLRAYVDSHLNGLPTPTLSIDAVVPLGEMQPPVLSALERLAPFGQHNTPPMLASLGLAVREARVVGTNHLKLLLSDAHGDTREAIAFRQAEWLAQLPQMIDIAYQVEPNRWNGSTHLQMNVRDIRPANGHPS